MLKRILQRIVYWLFRLAIGIGSIIPFSVLYYISDGLAFFLYRILRYRKKVVYQNLKNSFPNKTEGEIKSIMKKFYGNLADIILEGLKGYSVPPEELMPRFYYPPNPKLQEYYEAGQNVILIGSHFVNWEWGMMCGGMHSPHHVMCYYQPIRNSFIDDFYRKRFSTKDRNLSTVSKKQAVRNFVKSRNDVVAHLLMSDQSPMSRNNAIWLNFLNQDTICIIGPEKLSQKFGYPIFYMNIRRVKRGFYEITVQELESNPKATKKGEITEKFMRVLEQQIIDTPHNWLWSHKRWKKKRL